MKINMKALSCLCLALLLSGISVTLRAQDAEKQAVINAIDGELNGYLKKDKALWEKHWLHSPKARAVFVGADFYRQYISWDSVAASLKNHWTSKSTPKGSKSDYDVQIKGDVAIVHLKETWPDLTGSQTLLLVKDRKEWKIQEMHVVYDNTFANTDVAIEGGVNVQGYKLMALNKLDDAIKVFTLNTELYPDAFNTWDSLGEAYMKKGDKAKAIEYYEKSVALNPKNENGKKFLAELKK